MREKESTDSIIDHAKTMEEIYQILLHTNLINQRKSNWIMKLLSEEYGFDKLKK